MGVCTFIFDTGVFKVIYRYTIVNEWYNVIALPILLRAKPPQALQYIAFFFFVAQYTL